MQNEFEKQVQEKMGELNLVPSTPVWERIEKEIKEKKQKRRFLLWFPLLAGILILAGYFSLRVMNSGPSSQPVSATTNSNSKSLPSTPASKESLSSTSTPSDPGQAGHKPASMPGVPAAAPPHQTSRETSHQDQKRSTTETGKVNANDPSAREQAPGNTSGLSTHKKVSSTKRSSGNLHAVQQNKKNAKSSSASEGSADTGVTSDHLHTENTNTDSVSMITNKPSNVSQSDTSVMKVSDSAAIKPTPDSVATKEIAKPVVVRKRKWHIGVGAGVGFSTITNGVGIYVDKAAPVYSSAPQSFSQYPPLAESESRQSTRDGVALTASLILQRNLTKKLNLITGVGYVYNSYRSYIGTLIARADATAISGTITSATSRTFYTNRPSSGNEYVNEFHFVRIPVALSFRPFNSFPVFVDGGVSVQHLVASDALVYNPLSNVYYKDRSLLIKTQATANVGMGYHFFIGKMEMIAGPEFSYGLTPIDKRENKHFLNATINARIFFKK